MVPSHEFTRTCEDGSAMPKQIDADRGLEDESTWRRIDSSAFDRSVGWNSNDAVEHAVWTTASCLDADWPGVMLQADILSPLTSPAHMPFSPHISNSEDTPVILLSDDQPSDLNLEQITTPSAHNFREEEDGLPILQSPRLSMAPAWSSETLLHKTQPSLATSTVHGATLPAMVAAAGSLVPTPSSSPSARLACIPCRTAKVSCIAPSTTRAYPCVRCRDTGRTCVQRPAEEVEAAKQRRKRPRAATKHVGTEEQSTPQAKNSSTTSASASVISAVPCPLPSLSLQPLLTQRAEIDNVVSYSAVLRDVLIASGLRDDFLRVSALLDSVPPIVAERLQWTLSSHMQLLAFCDSMTGDDMRCWITAGMTHVQLHSSAFQASPLHAWCTPSSRPLFAFTELEHTQLRSSPKTLLRDTAYADCAQLLLTTDVSGADGCSLAAVRQWEQLEAQKRQYRWTIREARAAQQIPGGIQRGTATSSVDTIDEAALLASFGCLSVAISSLKRFAGRSETDTTTSDEQSVRVPSHALWCPCFPSTLGPYAESGVTSRVALLACNVHPECNCASAIPLRRCVRVNGGFERYFGWTSCEVDALMRREGAAFFRRLTTPEMWRHEVACGMIYYSQRALRNTAAYVQHIMGHMQLPRSLSKQSAELVLGNTSDQIQFCPPASTLTMFPCLLRHRRGARQRGVRGKLPVSIANELLVVDEPVHSSSSDSLFSRSVFLWRVTASANS